MRLAALLSQAALADQLGLSPRTLERWRVTGAGPRYLRLGRVIAYHPDDVAEWLAECRRTSTSDTGESVRAAS